MKSTAVCAALAALCLSGCASYTPIETSFNRGVRLYNDKNYAGAAREYRLALEEDPMDHRARFNLAMTLEEMGRTEQARAEYQWILSTRPQDLRAAVNLAAIEMEAGEREAAYARLEEVAARYDTMALPRVALATHYLKDGRLEDAERMARAALAIDEADIEANFILGEVLSRRAQSCEAGSAERVRLADEARKAYLAALANQPGDVASLLALGRLEMAEGRRDRARDYFRRVVLQRRWSLEAHVALADLSEESGDLEGAVHHLLQVRSLGGDRAGDVAPRLARLYAELQRQEELRTPVSRPASEQP
jgi:tetratricopeptide (TPR) repeat protein